MTSRDIIRGLCARLRLFRRRIDGLRRKVTHLSATVISLENALRLERERGERYRLAAVAAGVVLE